MIQTCHLHYHSGCMKKGNKQKLLNHIFHYDLRKQCISVRIVIRAEGIRFTGVGLSVCLYVITITKKL